MLVYLINTLKQTIRNDMNIKSLLFRQLEKHEIPLANQFYKRVYKKGVANKSEQVFVLKDKQIYCAARLKEGEDYLLLTGVACDPHVRRQGLASLLIRQLLQKQYKYPIYCFPYPDLQHFYLQLGFTQCAIEELPDTLASRYQRYNQRTPLLCMVKRKIN